jgi:hypothetical protein
MTRERPEKFYGICIGGEKGEVPGLRIETRGAQLRLRFLARFYRHGHAGLLR